MAALASWYLLETRVFARETGRWRHTPAADAPTSVCSDEPSSLADWYTLFKTFCRRSDVSSASRLKAEAGGFGPVGQRWTTGGALSWTVRHTACRHRPCTLTLIYQTDRSRRFDYIKLKCDNLISFIIAYSLTITSHNFAVDTFLLISHIN